METFPKDKVSSIKFLCQALYDAGYNSHAIKKIILGATGMEEWEKLDEDKLSLLEGKLEEQYRFAQACLKMFEK
ncbi:hypothetical protein [Candidatus Formimonas warabiya]|uniref:Uncharacterized protein n=1 Tax=Formimonas warabiya TaxID=1761012 RepID=A0A3G1KQC3_FORW1|nr:hypothetical protein [Candidatus Formimonas warabiya]ATW24672.1 hypothetical protein DCMF_07675 [Candidatus Formimonas warabiya]